MDREFSYINFREKYVRFDLMTFLELFLAVEKFFDFFLIDKDYFL